MAWGVLCDGPAYTEWDSGTHVEGAIGSGARLKVVNEAAPGRAFAVRVTAFAPPATMTWSGGMPLGLFRGVRTFRVTAVATGATVHVREEYTGPLLGMVWRAMPDLQPSFDRFTRGLKARAEALVAAG